MKDLSRVAFEIAGQIASYLGTNMGFNSGWNTSPNNVDKMIDDIVLRLTKETWDERNLAEAQAGNVISIASSRTASGDVLQQDEIAYITDVVPALEKHRDSAHPESPRFHKAMEFFSILEEHFPDLKEKDGDVERLREPLSEIAGGSNISDALLDHANSDLGGEALHPLGSPGEEVTLLSEIVPALIALSPFAPKEDEEEEYEMVAIIEKDEAVSGSDILKQLAKDPLIET